MLHLKEGRELILLTVGGHDITLYAGVISCVVFLFLLDIYLSIRQYCVVKRTTEVPVEYADITTSDLFHKARLYSIDKFTFSFCYEIFEIVHDLYILHFGILGYFWKFSQNHTVAFYSWLSSTTGNNWQITEENEILCTLTFVTYAVFYSLIKGFLWECYSVFVLEERHGFNKQTFGFFIKDKIKSTIVSLVIGLPVVSALIWIAQKGGQYFYVYTYIFCLVFTLVMMFIYPSFIAPLFDRYEPLPEGTLKTKIENLAASISFPLTKLLVVEGSKRSAHSNAYFYGFWKNKRIVLFDTLIKDFVFPGAEKDETAQSKGCSEDEEIVAVLAHELGHWKMNHISIHLLVSQINLFLMFCIFGMLIDMESIFVPFGFASVTAPFFIRLLIVFQYIFLPYNALFGYIMTFITRQLEFQADRFAVGLGFPEKLKSALVVLSKDNLSFPVHDWLYSAMNHSHPNILERMKAIDVEAKKK